MTIKKHLDRLLITALVFSVCFPAGVVSIVIGAVKGNTLLLVSGIIMTVAGFYGSPLLWVSYGNRRGTLNVCRMITEDGLRSIKLISAACGCKPKEASEHVAYLIKNRFITGYILDENGILKSIAQDIAPRPAPAGTTVTRKCPYCGANYTAQDNSPCPYCGLKA